MIQIIIDTIVIPYKKVVFSDGGSNLKLEVPEQLLTSPPDTYYAIVVDPTTPADNYVWEIIQAVEAIEQTFGDVFKKEYLYLPYLPHGRADRVFEYGNGFPLKLFFDAIYWMFDEVFLTDPHSDYYQHYSDNVEHGSVSVQSQHDCFMDCVRQNIQSEAVLIAPDAGALKKVYKLQAALALQTITSEVVEAGKTRCVETGKVLATTLPTEIDLTNKICWIVDDICDGGGTFIPLAVKLKAAGAKEVNLYVTHGIFAKGLSVFKGSIDKIYTYQTIGTYVNQIDINNFNKGII